MNVDTSAAEIMSVVTKLKNGKAAEVDEVIAGIIKCSGEFALEWLRKVCQVAWETG